MTPAARVQAAIDVLDLIIASARDNGPPADAIVAQWCRDHRFAGSKDKAAIRDYVWRAVRAYGDPPESGRAAMLGLGDVAILGLFDGSTHAPAPARANEPIALTSAMPGWFAAERPDWCTLDELAALLNRAPLDVRVNRLKADVDEVRAIWTDAVAITGLPDALRLADMPGADQHPLHREGKVEVQDAGSQHVVRMAMARPGETVIDLCAGAGGKTLALAAAMQGNGRLIACDTSRARLAKLAPRSVRAGITALDMMLLDPGKEMAALEDTIGQADLVLVDAPCSGTGTWRRSPDLRWRMSARRLEQVENLQRHILGLAEQLVRPGGRLAYAVCSVRDAEGARQVEALAARWKAITPDDIGRPRGAGRLLTPLHDQTDGFFVAVLQKPC